MEMYEMITLPTEEEVFGHNGEERKIVDFLKRNVVQGNFDGAKLGLFKNQGVSCEITDLVVLLGGDPNQICTRSPGIIQYASEPDRIVTYKQDGTPSRIGATDREGVIRPILNIPEDVDLDEFEDFERIEYGEYPQYAPNLEMQERLESEYQQKSNKMILLDEVYTIDCSSIYSSSMTKPTPLKVYQYEDKKYVRFPFSNKYNSKLSNGIRLKEYDKDYCWLEVSPLEWRLDKKSRKLVSEKGIISNIPFASGFPRYSSLTSSQVGYFLIDYLLPEMVHEKEDIHTIKLEKRSSKTI